MTNPITRNYEKWKDCLKNNLGSELNLKFVEQRIATLGDLKNKDTKKFIDCYGTARLEEVLSWFKLLKEELS